MTLFLSFCCVIPGHSVQYVGIVLRQTKGISDGSMGLSLIERGKALLFNTAI